MRYTWILLFLFSCQTKSTQVETASDTASAGDVVTSREIPDSATLPQAPTGIEGNYVMGESSGCNLQISIVKTGNGYSYELKTSKRNVKGRITFIKGEAIEEMYISFLGFPSNDPAGDDDKTEANDGIAQTLEALYSDGALDIQNSGNAMNSYEKLAECSDKFIHLEKKK